jgi:putative addiction module component (TIGR02574 family)
MNSVHPTDSRLLGFALVKIHRVSETCTMPITLDQIVEETSEMPGEVVAELIDRIMVARHGGIEPSVVESWKTETDRRIAEIESGKVKGVPLEESLARARKIAGL